MANTVSFSLAPNPIWYFDDITGKPLSGGYLVTLSSQNPSVAKLVYQDAGGANPWPYLPVPNTGTPSLMGIHLDAKGTTGPLYFKFDSTTANDLYFLQLFDANGVQQWSINNFTGISGIAGSGGGTITNSFFAQNLIINSIMYRNIGATPVAPGTFLKLAPGANAGLVQTASNFGPDIVFIKSNNSSTDTVAFLPFTLGSIDLTMDVTPPWYFNYNGNAGSGESYKYVQFPITQGVQNLSNVVVTTTIWAKGHGTAGNTLALSFVQFFSDGTGASTKQTTPINTYTLTGGWVQYTATTTISSVTGKNLGTPTTGNDGLFLQIAYPVDEVTNIDFTKPAVYLGTSAPTAEFNPYDKIDAYMDTARTGDVRTSLRSDTILGWLLMNDLTIGSASSNATARANLDTFPLFDVLWNISGTYSPMLTSGGAPTTRGASSVADFLLNNQLTLTKTLGRALASSGTGAGLSARVLGQYLGEETHSIIANELPAHTHPFVVLGNNNVAVGGHVQLSADNENQNAPGMTTGNNTTTHTAMNVMQPTTFLNVFIKL